MAFSRKVVNVFVPSGQIRKISSIYRKYAMGYEKIKKCVFNIMHKHIGVCRCHFCSHGCVIDLQILLVAKHKKVMFQY